MLVRATGTSAEFEHCWTRMVFQSHVISDIAFRLTNWTAFSEAVVGGIIVSMSMLLFSVLCLSHTLPLALHDMLADTSLIISWSQ